MVRAVYPGTFDPITSGHLNITARAAALFDEVIVMAYDAPPKRLMFDTAERVDLFRRAIAEHGLTNVEVRSYAGLTVKVARELGAQVMVRGIRAFEDFVYEADMAMMNRKLEPELEVVYLLTHAEYAFVSSSRVKEIAALGADVSEFVPPVALAALRDRLAGR